MFFITFECLDEYDKSFQMNLLAESLNKQRISNSVVNINGSGYFNDDISKLYKYLDNEASYSLSEKFFLQLTRRSRQIEHLFRPAFTRQNDVHYSVILCPHSPEGLATLFGDGYKYGQNNVLFSICQAAYSKVRTNLSIVINIPPEKALQRSPIKFSSKEEGIHFYERVQHGIRDLHDFTNKGPNPNLLVIDGTQSPETIHKIIFQEVLNRMK
jgi:thymidylate kinase